MSGQSSVCTFCIDIRSKSRIVRHAERMLDPTNDYSTRTYKPTPPGSYTKAKRPDCRKSSRTRHRIGRGWKNALRANKFESCKTSFFRPWQNLKLQFTSDPGIKLLFPFHLSHFSFIRRTRLEFYIPTNVLEFKILQDLVSLLALNAKCSIFGSIVRCYGVQLTNVTIFVTLRER